jgi:aminopeptidase
MKDPRHERLARVLVDHSTKIKKGDVAIVQGIGLETYPLARTVARAVISAGGIPLLKIEETDAVRDLVMECNEGQLGKLGSLLLEEMKRAQVYIGIRGSRNVYELAEVPSDRLKEYNRHILQPVHLEQRVKHTRWCVLRYPNAAMAQLASQPTDAFEDYYFDVCTIDYAHMAEAVRPLHDLMLKTDQVRITSPGTDLRFSIGGIGVVPCAGEKNIPDGECFTAPVRDSIEGTVTFNTPTLYEGRAFERIRLRFEGGKAVEAEDGGGNTEELNRILDRDEGARYAGEWAIAFNPMIRKPMRDILFDEKIGGSWHLALGQAYEETQNGNTSAIHWDLIQIQTPDHGGGTLELDGRVVRKDGLFVVPELEGLNPKSFLADDRGRS